MTPTDPGSPNPTKPRRAYFLGKFALAEGRGGGEFFTPTSIVRLIVDILEPFHGKIYDPACGSGGMFVQSAHFVERHQHDPSQELSIYGQERVGDTVRLAKMNLAVHGLGGDIRQGNTYYEDLHDSFGQFDFVMANPPFNVDKVDKTKLENDPRFELGLPKADNANYLWIQTFYSALNGIGRAGFVMANSASDARGSELEIRRRLVEDRCVDVIVAVGTNMFYTVTLPVTLWFLDRGKRDTARKDKVLFIDARETYNQIDRAHRDWTTEQIEFLANIVRLWREEEPEDSASYGELLSQSFPNGTYENIEGLCSEASIERIETQSWSLNPGRYVGRSSSTIDDFEFTARLELLEERFEELTAQAGLLSSRTQSILGEVLSKVSWTTKTLGDLADVNWGNTSVTKKSYVPDGFQAYSASGPDGFVGWAEHNSPGVVVSAIGAQCGKTWFAQGSWTPIKEYAVVSFDRPEC